MGDVIEIYGSKIRLPDEPPISEMLYCDLPYKKQKWVKEDLPEYFDAVEIDKNGDVVLTLEQRLYATEQVKRCKNGVWAMIGGKARYLTGKYYFFLQNYTLEDGNAPDFREADRQYFLFHEHWFKIDWCLGNIRTKKRRQGASSQSCSNILYEAIFFKNSNCGLISKTKDDSKETFTQMISNAYQQLPIYLKPKQVNKEDSVTELVFAHKAEQTKGAVVAAVNKKKGNNSRINYKAPVLNAYDRGRMSYVLGDEFGKYPKDVPASQLLAIISKTLVKGVKRVGWIDLPSTTNEMLKGGGMEYYKIWKAADQSKARPTTNRVVRFFQPAYEAYEGFIDEFGDSVIDAPTEDQYEYLVKKWVKRDPETDEVTSELSEEKIRLGAKHYVKVDRRLGLEGIDLEEEMRMNPCNEEEAFMSAVSDCVFNSVKIKKRQKELEDNPVFKRAIVFFRDEETQKVKWRDINNEEKSFHWQITWFPKPEDQNKIHWEAGKKFPGRTEDGVIAVDSYSNSQGGRKYGSKACALIGRRSDLIDPENTGKPIGMLYGRPLEKDRLHQQVLLAAEFYGYPTFYEHSSDDYDGYFKDRGKTGYLGRYPKSMIDPTKRETQERHRGTPITPFSLTKQLDNGISFFEHHCDKVDWMEILDNALIFDPQDRTAYDILVSFLILISVLMERPVKPPPKKHPLIETFPNVRTQQAN
jgi:hypothetical protein